MNATDAIQPPLRGKEPCGKLPRNSESLSQMLLNQLPVCIFHKDRQGRYVFVNAQFCRLYQAEAEEFIGRTPREIAAAHQAREGKTSTEMDKRDLFDNGEKHHASIVQTGRTIEIEESHTDANGEQGLFLAIKGPLFGPDGAIIGSQGILLDITARKRAEAQFANERDMLHALLSSSTDAVYFKDRQSRFLRSSDSMAPQFNLKNVGDLIGKTDFDFFGGDHARRAFEDEQEIIRTGRPVIGKTEKEEYPDGRVSWALTSKMPYYNTDGEIIGTLGISKNITAFKQAETSVEQLHKQLLLTSREAGMAEVATSILHNVGNVLNSVNVSASLLLDSAKKSKASSLAKAVALLNDHAANLGEFLASDPKGKQLAPFLNLLSEELAREQHRNLAELELLRENIEHVKEIVAMQQSYARVSGVIETVKASEIVEDALRINAGALARHGVVLIREYTDDSVLSIEKHKVLQILVNLIRNSKYACDDSGRKDKQIRLKISKHDQWVSIAIIDNGVGIPPENLTRIFNYGFTTRKAGHGFGLHSGALTAKELGGSLTVHSEGPGSGASFILDLPPQPPSRDKAPA